jgi:hypothetical protein
MIDRFNVTNTTYRMNVNNTFASASNFTSNVNVTGNITMQSGGYGNCMTNRTGTAYICHNGTGWIIKG